MVLQPQAMAQFAQLATYVSIALASVVMFAGLHEIVFRAMQALNQQLSSLVEDFAKQLRQKLEQEIGAVELEVTLW